LPDYYGRNLDALYDVLSEQGDEMDITIVNREGADQDIQPYIDDLVEVMEDVSTQVDDFTVRVEDSLD
jgi:ribonuclease inhibitor